MRILLVSLAAGVFLTLGCSKPREFLSHPYSLTKYPEVAPDDQSWTGQIITITEVVGDVIRERVVVPSLIASIPEARIYMTTGSGDPVETVTAAIGAGFGESAEDFEVIGFDFLNVQSGDVRFVPAEDAEQLRTLAEDDMGFAVLLHFSGFDTDTGRPHSKNLAIRPMNETPSPAMP